MQKSKYKNKDVVCLMEMLDNRTSTSCLFKEKKMYVAQRGAYHLVEEYHSLKRKTATFGDASIHLKRT